jgi:hypothetical protein
MSAHKFPIELGWTGFSKCWTGFSKCWTGFNKALEYINTTVLPEAENKGVLTRDILQEVWSENKC